MESHDYQDLTLIDLYVNHQDEFAIEQILKKYARLTWAMVYKYKVAIEVMGIHKDDLYQEGMVGLVDSVKAYNKDFNVPFRFFAKVCVERQIQSLIRKYYGLSYSLIHKSVPLHAVVSEDENLTLIDTIACPDSLGDPVKTFYFNQMQANIEAALHSLDDLHQKIARYRLSGYTYNEIAERCDCSYKTVDNALQKIKKKLKCLFD